MARHGWIPLALLALTSVARADVVMPPMARCPAGTTPATSHAGPHCGLAPPCEAASCAAGERCAPVRLCVTSVHCGGWSVGDPNCAEQHVTDAEPCEGEWIEHPACIADAAPEPEPTPPTTSPPAAGGCAHCSAGAGAGPSGVAFALVLLALALRRR